MENSKDADDAVFQLNHTDLDGRTITVEKARQHIELHFYSLNLNCRDFNQQGTTSQFYSAFN